MSIRSKKTDCITELIIHGTYFHNKNHWTYRMNQQRSFAGLFKLRAFHI